MTANAKNTNDFPIEHSSWISFPVLNRFSHVRWTDHTGGNLDEYNVSTPDGIYIYITTYKMKTTTWREIVSQGRFH